MPVDSTPTCCYCGQPFVFTISEQEYYASRGVDNSTAAARPRGTQGRTRWRPPFVDEPRGTRDVQRNQRELREESSGAVPAQRRQAGLLLGLLPGPSRIAIGKPVSWARALVMTSPRRARVTAQGTGTLVRSELP